ncbi:hypothetical protein jhhlp_008757 [Lomentospora prolificans]|uniref:Uncharacterized protein n=1 Tax=Lomentospora prolificans TaxID=41688 RepID=A0A2N3MYY1_9PEZI|nr:hypothetical protein jhhlp_008757 [Lomentospora prolificans]
MAGDKHNNADYSSVQETKRLLQMICNRFSNEELSLPKAVLENLQNVVFTARRDLPYFPIPFKETETTAALKAVEGSVASCLVDLKAQAARKAAITVNLEKTTAFLFQTYLATVGGYGKLEPEAKAYIKDTDLLKAQSNPYRRMSANLYETKTPGEYYHIHGSLEASQTLDMIGLPPFRDDLKTHDDIVAVIEGAVRKFSTTELEEMNAARGQAGVPAMKYSDFIKTPHGKINEGALPWSVSSLETMTPATPLPQTDPRRPLAGIKVLELCRVIAGPVMGRILAEYGADVLKVTSPNLSDVPFFQIDVNMGKHTAELDLKTPEDRKTFEALLCDVDIVLDGYRPGAIEKLGYGASKLQEIAQARGKGIVYVNENCFGYQGEWAGRPGWQQIADCVSGVAWEQGKFMGLQEPVVPPFPISDYGTGCMGAIAALVGLYHRTTRGGSWHGKTSLLQYDLLLFKAGLYPDAVAKMLKDTMEPEFLALRHAHSVDQISGTALRGLKKHFPEFFSDDKIFEKWFSEKYNAEIVAVRPVVELEGALVEFQRASRPNGSDSASWDFGINGDKVIN